MGVLEIMEASKVYVRVPIVATVDPTNDAVAFAFLDPADDGPDDSTVWNTGSWDPTVTSSPFVAMILVGPGGTVTLAAGDYAMSVKITDNPEIPVQGCGVLSII